MATKTKNTVKDSNQEPDINLDLLENPEALQEQFSKTEEFAKKNQEVILGGLAVILLAVAGFFWYGWMQENDEKAAQAELFPSVFFMEKDSLSKALAGDNGATTIGLQGITDEYSSSKAANLSQFYIGVAQLEQGKFDEAISALKEFSCDDYIVQGRAYCLIGDAYMEKEDLDNAISYYKKASEYNPNSFSTPDYLLKLGLAYELKGDMESAAATYRKFVENEDYKTSEEFAKAEKLLARAEHKLSAGK